MTTKFTLTIFLLLSFILSANSQKLNWTTTSAGNEQFGVQVSEYIWDVEATSTNVAVTGYITGSNAKFGDIVITNGSNGSYPSDVYTYLANYDATGKALWVKRLSRISQADIAVDANKNIWVAFTDDISKAFIRKYSQNGELLLEKAIQISTDIELTSITIDASQAIILTGLLHGNKSSIMVEGREYTGIYGDSKTDYAIEGFVMKYDQSQEFKWFTVTKGSELCLIMDAEIDKNNNIIVVGEFTTESNKQLQFGSDIKLSAHPYYSTTYTSGFIAKVSSEGQFLWADNIRSQSDSWLNGVAINEQNQIHVIGSFNGSATLKNSTISSKGSNDILFSKLDTDGNVLWLKSAGSNYPYGLGDVGRSIATDKHGNIFLSGSFMGYSTFGEGDAAITLKTEYAHSKGGYVAQYTTNGDIVWAEKINGPNGPNGSKAEIQKIAVNGTTLYTSGNFFQPVSMLNTSLPIAYPDMDHVFLTSIDFSSMVTALPELRESAQHISVYPNPATGEVKLDVKQPIGKVKSLQIVGVTGQLLVSIPDYNPSQPIDLSGLPAGLYNLILQTDKYVINKKIIKR